MNNTVEHPSYYNIGKIEVIDFINDQNLNFALGNVIKYVSRAGKKEEKGKTNLEKQIEDLEKAKYYLEHEIKTLKQTRQNDSDKMN